MARLREGSTVAIRPATPADAAPLGPLGALLVRTHHDFDPARFIAAGRGTEQAYADVVAGQRATPTVAVLVAGSRRGPSTGTARRGRPL